MVKFGFKKLLVPTDLSKQADNAIQFAIDACSEPQDVTALHVAAPMGNYPVGDPAIVWETVSEEDRRRHMEENFRLHMKDLSGGQPEFAVLFGSPAEEIVDYAEHHDIDLIVMPSHGRSALKRLLLGSVAERVVRMSHCPVMVLRS